MVDVDYNADTWSGQLKYGSNLGGRAGTSLGATYLQAVTPRLSLGGEVGARTHSYHSHSDNVALRHTLRCVALHDERGGDVGAVLPFFHCLARS